MNARKFVSRFALAFLLSAASGASLARAYGPTQGRVAAGNVHSLLVKADGTVALRMTGELTLEQVKQLVDAAEGKEVAPAETTTGTTPLTSPAPTTTVAP
mgnify:CR=1 FL=1